MIIDHGPDSCVEEQAGGFVLAASVPLSIELFDRARGRSSLPIVVVEPVPPDTPLGPASLALAFQGNRE